MNRSPVALAALLVTILLTGCATTPVPTLDPPEPILEPSTPTSTAPPNSSPNSAPATIVLDAQGCQSIAVALLTEPAVASAALPEGFFARDASELLDIPAASQQAAFVVTWSTCLQAANETEPASMGTLAVFVEHPASSAETADRDFYVIQHWEAWPSLTGWLETWGVPTSVEAEPAFTVHVDQRHALPDPAGRPDPGPSAMALDVTGNASSSFSARIGGTTGYRMADEVFRFWYAVDDATLWIDMIPTNHGTGGAVKCDFAPESVFAQWTQQKSCGEDGAVGVASPTSDVSMTGTALRRAG